MTATNTHLQPPSGETEKKLVALSSVASAVFLTGMKLVVGLLTGSLGILSEAAHSGLDLVAALVTYFAVRISGRPADARYTFGYGKVENISALFETFLLLLTCVWIIYEAILRLFFKSVEVDISVWSFIIMGISILVDIARSRALAAAAKKYSSQALEADALHFSTDIWSSSVVIAGLFLVLLAERLSLPWLAKADALAALGVAGIVVYVSLQLGRKTVEALLDAVPAGLRDEVTRAVSLEGVEGVRQVRIRRSGPETFVELTLIVSQATPLEQAHDIANRAEAAVVALMPGADVLVNVHPYRSDHEGLHAAIQRVANRQGAIIHGIRIYENGSSGRTLELHMEASEHLSLEEAHAKADALELALRGAPFNFERVVVHIEPVGEASIRRAAESGDEARVANVLEELQEELDIPCRPHDITVYRLGDELTVSLHCLAKGDMPVGEAHQYTERLERLMRSKLPELGRIVIHMEAEEKAEQEN